MTANQKSQSYRLHAVLAASLALSLCACAHAPASATSPSSKGTPTMTTTETTTSAPQPDTHSAQSKLTAEQVLLRLLDAIRGSDSINDFTPEYLSKIMGVEFKVYRPGNYGFGEKITDEWWYGMEVYPLAQGPQFTLSFDEQKKGSYPDMTSICQVDFEQFGTALETMGFERRKNYAEHGRYTGDSFTKSTLHINIIGQGERLRPAPSEAPHGCIKMIVIN